MDFISKSQLTDSKFFVLIMHLDMRQDFNITGEQNRLVFTLTSLPAIRHLFYSTARQSSSSTDEFRASMNDQLTLNRREEYSAQNIFLNMN